jgi:hypothetical protein
MKTMAKTRRKKRVTEEDRTFTVKYLEGDEPKEITCKIVDPTVEQLDKADEIYTSAWHTAIKSGAILSAKLGDFVREQGLWDDEKEARITSIRKEIDSLLEQLGKRIKLSVAKETALNIRRLRTELRELLSVQTQHMNLTAEGKADEKKMNYLISCCTVYNDTGEPVWKDVAAFQSPSIPELAIRATAKFYNLWYGVSEDFEHNLPENEFLSMYKLVDDNLRLVNNDGELVDTEGRRIDEFGNFINDKGERVDINGRRVDENGLPIIEFGQFLDEDGNEIPIPSDEEEEETEAPSQETNEEETPQSE